MRFGAAALARHVADFNTTLGLTNADCIVSWLPLYHDMGYIACFVMPLMLGVKVAMMDPLDWVQAPSSLFRAIAEHGGTVCYMPNFGFEVMCREPPLPGLDGMRWWISCSEPVSAATARKFIAHVSADEATFAPCYAMAENVFAVSIRRGLRTALLDGTERVSCGAPVTGVAAKIVDGEIFVRSPVSVAAYVGGEDIRDDEGFYPTGDLGMLVDGEVYVIGRRQDVLVQAGRKFMLSDVDSAVSRILPETRGRAAALALADPALGTERLTVLIEARDFFLRTDAAEIAGELGAHCGIEALTVAFVPPRFLTKTSSGKINRKQTARDYLAALSHQADRKRHRADPVADMKAVFSTLDWTQPCKWVLDSLSLVVLRTLLADANLDYQPELSLQATAELLRAGAQTNAQAADDTIRVVSLADGVTMRGQLSLRLLNGMAQRLGRPVDVESLCLPPAPVLLSDLIFNDWFQPRLDQEPFSVVDSLLGRLRNATVIVVDDRAEIAIPRRQVYGVLSHGLARHRRADLLMTRWQRYAQNHDRLPVTIATGADLHPRHRNAILAMLSAYLGVPIFRVATSAALREWTGTWEYRNYENDRVGIDGSVFVTKLADFLAERRPAPTAAPGVKPEARLSAPELAHYCAHMARRDVIENIIEHFRSFCIVGQRSSLPYLRRRLEELRRPYALIPSFAPEIVATLPDRYECMVIAGAWGDHDPGLPAVSLMFSNRDGWRTKGPGLEFLEQMRFIGLPPSADDWFCPFPLEREPIAGPFIEAREEVKRAARQRMAPKERGGLAAGPTGSGPL
jgi:hypothetical protein